MPHPRFADSPGATSWSPAARARILSLCLTPGSRTHRGIAFCRPLRGLVSFLYVSPPVRGLTGGYILVARRAGSYPFFMSHPPFADSPGASVLAPAARARILSYASPPVRDSPGATSWSPAARARTVRSLALICLHSGRCDDAMLVTKQTPLNDVSAQDSQ